MCKTHFLHILISSLPSLVRTSLDLMIGSRSPYGAFKFLRRKCVKGCVFAPLFCHEEGATHFSAIHKVFGASNVSKFLTYLHVSERLEATVPISYKAQAKLQDPIYGCVFHIFALQQQVVNLHAQLAYLNGSVTENPKEKYFGKPSASFPHYIQGWFQIRNFDMGPQFLPNLFSGSFSTIVMDPNPIGNYEMDDLQSMAFGLNTRSAS